MNTAIKHRCLKWGVIALQAFIGFTAIAGGYNLVSHPDGTMQTPIEWLHASPFETFLAPGIVLLIAIGVGNVFSLALIIAGNRHIANLAFIGGGCLIVYMVAEIWWIGLQTSLQPLYLALGSGLLLCGLTLRGRPFIESARPSAHPEWALPVPVGGGIEP